MASFSSLTLDIALTVDNGLGMQRAWLGACTLTEGVHSTPCGDITISCALCTGGLNMERDPG